MVRAEPALLVRAIGNLVSNAVRSSPRGSAVTVALRAQPDGFAVTVTDHGPGIALARQQRLFEPFARLHEHEPDAPAGSGLGLVLTKTVVERHGGSIRVASDAGAGSHVHCTCPRRVADRSPTQLFSVAPSRNCLRCRGRVSPHCTTCNARSASQSFSGAGVLFGCFGIVEGGVRGMAGVAFSSDPPATPSKRRRLPGTKIAARQAPQGQ
ncbi:sensor histidine kinase [Cupriavidus basilensis]